MQAAGKSAGHTGKVSAALPDGSEPRDPGAGENDAPGDGVRAVGRQVCKSADGGVTGATN